MRYSIWIGLAILVSYCLIQFGFFDGVFVAAGTTLWITASNIKNTRLSVLLAVAGTAFYFRLFYL